MRWGATRQKRQWSWSTGGSRRPMAHIGTRGPMAHRHGVVAGEQNHVSTRSRAVPRNSTWRRCNDRARRCERGRDPAVGRRGARAPVAVEHRRLLSSACAHWHRKVQRRAVVDEQNQPLRRCNDWARRCLPREGHAVGHHGAEAPVAVEHRRFPSSDGAHWHTRPDGAPSRASKTMFHSCPLIYA